MRKRNQSKDTGKGGSVRQRFRVEEATIDDLHRAIEAGTTNCVDVVRQYIARVRAYNGVSSVLVTEGGDPVPEAIGPVRAGLPLRFPTGTVKASAVLPDLDAYRGPPLEYGRMEATASDPDVQQQYGMIVGIPDAGQVNALATLNIRGERSVTCRGEFDRHPSAGPLPPGAPPVCEFFRQLPDALERAAELDAIYGRKPDLKKLPMYGVVFSFKDSFDTKDMRSTGGADAQYDIDFPARDHILVQQLRDKGAIIFAKAVCTEYNGRAGNPGGQHKPRRVLPSTLGYQRSTWAGNPSNPYDTTRAASLGSSSGSAVSVSINLVMASLGEETRASCRGPSNHNAVALILPHKSLLGFDGGAIGADIYVDRSGVHCRTIGDCAKVLDALKDPVEGYYDPRDPFTTVPRTSILSKPYADYAMTPGAPGTLTGVRLGIIRKSMTYAAGSKAEEPIVTAAAHEIKTILGGKLGATLVEFFGSPLDQGSRGRAHEDGLPAGIGKACPHSDAGAFVQAGYRRAANFQGIRRHDSSDGIPTRQNLRRWLHAADRLLHRTCGRTDRTALQSGSRNRSRPGTRDGLQVPYSAVSDPTCIGLESARLCGISRQFSDIERAVEILGRRPTCGLQELGRCEGYAQSARRTPRRQ